MTRDHVTVGIVGGGVAGLALARMLELLGVSYILYEGCSEIAPDAGASLGLVPNGLRILDQLGVLDQIEAFRVAHDRWEHRDGRSGALYKATTAARRNTELFGYDGFFMARRDVLKILFNSLEDKTRIHVSKKVTSIEDVRDSALVTAADGSSFSCSFVAGADGVRSVVREHIFAQTTRPSPEYLRAETACVFGMSKPLPAIGPGRCIAVYRPKASALVFSGLGAKLYWFLFQQLAQPIEYGQRRRFTDADIEAVHAELADAPVTDGVKISDVFASRETAVMTALEEGVCDTWHHGRMFLLGDSAHKMVPHAAMGANQALESAACFVNKLRQFHALPGAPGSHVSRDQVDECLRAYVRDRQAFVGKAFQGASASCRNQLMIGAPAEQFLRNLPGLTDRELLLKSAGPLSQAQKLEDWPHGSERVRFYTSRSKGVVEMLSREGVSVRSGPTGADTTVSV